MEGAKSALNPIELVFFKMASKGYRFSIKINKLETIIF